MPVTLGVIPARLASTRLPGKVLRPLLGRPMLQWVVEAALRCPQLDGVIVATDSQQVADLCQNNGWLYQMTDPDLPSGTDRMRAVAMKRKADIYVNIQGDEPLLMPEHIDALLRPFARGPQVECTTVKTACSPENISNPNAVKVVHATDGRALYFSRATIPYDRDASIAGNLANGKATYWKHLGLYAYRRPALLRFGTLEASPLEQTERLEQLRLLENGLALYVEAVDFDTVGVDTEADIPRVEALLRERFRS
jgi:3-deoxy-manno-octulosonate cytidylyltransferase (CMP-KDO synthetase)